MGDFTDYERFGAMQLQREINRVRDAWDIGLIPPRRMHSAGRTISKARDVIAWGSVRTDGPRLLKALRAYCSGR